MQDLRSLQVWGRRYQLTIAVYKVTATFPKDELYSLASQIRRACASIPANITKAAEGAEGRVRTLSQVSMGSASELGHPSSACSRPGVSEVQGVPQLHAQAVEVKRMLSPLIGSLRRR